MSETDPGSVTPGPVRRLRPLLGTFVEIGVNANDTTPGNRALVKSALVNRALVNDAINDAINQAIDAAFATIQQIHDLASFQNPHSALSQLNQAPGQWQTLPRPLLTVLRLARLMTAHSGRLFNCTVGGALVQSGLLPDHGGPEALPAGDEHDIVIRGQQVRLQRPVRITLDGIAKGFAVDRAIGTMRAHGIRSGWINAGGDLRAFGELRLPVQRREPDQTLRSLGWLQNAAVATSIVWPAPEARYPAWIVGDDMSREARAWTVLARRTWRADALTKVAALASAQERQGLIEALGGRLLEPAETLGQ